MACQAYIKEDRDGPVHKELTVLLRKQAVNFIVIKYHAKCVIITLGVKACPEDPGTLFFIKGNILNNI